MTPAGRIIGGSAPGSVAGAATNVGPPGGPNPPVPGQVGYPTVVRTASAQVTAGETTIIASGGPYILVLPPDPANDVTNTVINYTGTAVTLNIAAGCPDLMNTYSMSGISTVSIASGSAIALRYKRGVQNWYEIDYGAGGGGGSVTLGGDATGPSGANTTGKVQGIDS